MKDHNSRLISIVGPTAVGKTALAIELAQRLDTEIVSADSRQFYREMELGTAKPSLKELNKVRHHFINSHSIEEYYSAGEFERDVLVLLDQLFDRMNSVILVGGSGLYIKGVWEGFDDIPKVDETIREQLNNQFSEQGLIGLLAELARDDPEYYQQVDKKNHQRVIRALEVIRMTNSPFSAFRMPKSGNNRPFEMVKIGLEMDREKLNERIDLRMDNMIASGLFEEAERLFSRKHLNALQTVGYKEIFDFIESKYDKQEAIRLLKRNSRRYAKRQMTWFKADPEIKWFNSATPVEDILVYLQP